MNNPDRGRLAVRYLKCLAAARGDTRHAAAFAAGQGWRDGDSVVNALKAAVDPIGTGDASEFVVTPAGFDFAEFVRPLSIAGRLPLRRVPVRTRLIAAGTGVTAYWTGEAQPKPLSRATFTSETLDPLKVVAVVVISDELARSSAPSAEGTLSIDLGRAITQATDIAFLDPANAGTPGQTPASVTNGATPFPSSGSSLANIDGDLGTLVDALASAGSDLNAAAWIMRPTTATYLARLRGSGGAPAYPGMTAKGGVLLGLTAITSANVPDAGSPGETTITLLDPSQIWLADDGGSELATARQTSLQMVDDPATGPVQQVSLWQNNLVALRVERVLNWRVCRDGMVQVLDGVSY